MRAVQANVECQGIGACKAGVAKGVPWGLDAVLLLPAQN